MQKTTPGMLLGQTSKLPVGGDGDLPVSSEKAMRQTGDHLFGGKLEAQAHIS
jgi:hypothetical protein